MKKKFLIFGFIGCFFTINGYAVQSGSSVIVTYTCEPGCELRFSTGTNGSTHAYCETAGGRTCSDPVVNVYNASMSDVIQQITNSENLNKVKKRPVSSRSAETPKMVKKIVYEQVVEEDEE